MKGQPWVLWLSQRWFSARRASGGAASSVLASAGIAIGVTALVVVLGVMNGFQLGYIDSILEISSYHVRVKADGKGEPDGSLIARLRSEKTVRSVVPFLETQVLLSSSNGRSSPVKIRAIPANAPVEDRGFSDALGISPEAFAEADGIVIGAELARYLNVVAGDKVQIISLLSNESSGILAHTESVRINQVFRSGFYDYDFGLGFIDIQGAAALFPLDEPRSYTYGIKLESRNDDAAMVARFEALGIPAAEGWRDYNRSFFSALRTEKTMMLLLVGLIFLVVGVNIFQSMRRNVLERMEEMALIKAIGGGIEELRSVFILDGLFIGLIGSFAGLVLGLLVATNVNAIFVGVGSLLNALSVLVSTVTGSQSSDFSIFSPDYFYLMEVTVRLLFPEIFFIVAAAIASSAAAAALAASYVSSLEPAELLRHE